MGERHKMTNVPEHFIARAADVVGLQHKILMHDQGSHAEFGIWHLSRFGWIDYRHSECAERFEAWQASRAAVVIELPEGMTIAEHMYGVVSPPGHERWFPRKSAVQAIEASGLKVKP